jgi:hypothetical protein
MTKFQNGDEGQAWAIFMASQCARLSAVLPDTKYPDKREREIAAAGELADLMLSAWRERSEGMPRRRRRGA